MSFNWHGNPRQSRVRVTAFAPDHQALQTWDFDLTTGQRISIPPGTCTVCVEDPSGTTGSWVDLDSPRQRTG